MTRTRWYPFAVQCAHDPAMSQKPFEIVLDAEQEQFCAEWLESHGAVERPTVDQLVEMTDAYAAHRRRWQQQLSGKGFRPLG